MKKLLISLLIVLLNLASFAQDKPAVSTEKNVLKINTLSLFVGTGSIFYERKMSDLISPQMGLGFMSFKLGDTKFSGLILTPECRFYAKKNAIDGMYVAPYLRYQRFTVETNDGMGSLTSTGGGLVLGRQWITDSGFTMDLFFGGHYGNVNVKVDSGTDSFDRDFFKGFKTRMGFALGFAF
jgi:hypothetical protein